MPGVRNADWVAALSCIGAILTVLISPNSWILSFLRYYSYVKNDRALFMQSSNRGPNFPTPHAPSVSAPLPLLCRAASFGSSQKTHQMVDSPILLHMANL